MLFEVAPVARREHMRSHPPSERSESLTPCRSSRSLSSKLRWGSEAARRSSTHLQGNRGGEGGGEVGVVRWQVGWVGKGDNREGGGGGWEKERGGGKGGKSGGGKGQMAAGGIMLVHGDMTASCGACAAGWWQPPATHRALRPATHLSTKQWRELSRVCMDGWTEGARCMKAPRHAALLHRHTAFSNSFECSVSAA